MNGGARPGAGRKTIAAEIARKSIKDDGAIEAEYAFSLFVSQMHGGRISKARLAAAAVVMDRVLGKPKQVLAGAPNEPLEIAYVTVDYRRAYANLDPADAEAGPIENCPAPSQEEVAGDGKALGEKLPGS